MTEKQEVARITTPGYTMNYAVSHLREHEAAIAKTIGFLAGEGDGCTECVLYWQEKLESVQSAISILTAQS